MRFHLVRLRLSLESIKDKYIIETVTNTSNDNAVTLNKILTRAGEKLNTTN